MIALLLSLAAWGCDAVVGSTAFIDGALRDDTTVVWVDGVITRVDNAPAPEGCTVHAVDVITPALSVVGTPLGLVEIALEASSRDDTYARPDPVTPSLRVSDAFDPASQTLPLARQGGIAHAVIVPSGGLVGGSAAWVSIAGTSQAASVHLDEAGLVVDLDALGSRAAAFAAIRRLLDDAALWAKRPDPSLRGTLSAAPDALEAVSRAVQRNQPALWVVANRAADIEATTRFAATYGLRVVIVGGAEAWKVADALAAVDAGVLIDPMVYGPGPLDARHARPDGAARLERAGVSVSFSVEEPHRARSLRWIAGNAVRAGMPWEAALAAITQVPSTWVGDSDRGRIAVGQRADLALWSGDPLDIPTRLLALVVDGAPVSLRSRHDALAERYRTLPVSPWPDPPAGP